MRRALSRPSVGDVSAHADATPVRGLGALLGRVTRLGISVRLMLLAAVLSLVSASIVATWIENQVTALMLTQVAVRAEDQVQLEILTSTRNSDFEPPYSADKREDLAARLDPLLARARQSNSGIIRLNLFARDGTILYSDLAELRGRTVSPLANNLLGLALGGKAGAEMSSLVGVENTDLHTRYGRALEAYIPFALDGQVVGVYEFYEDLEPIAPIRPLVWVGVLASSTVPLVCLLFALSRVVARTPREQQTAVHEVEPLPSLAARISVLTRREVQVLQLMAAELTYSQIADRLTIDEETVRSHAKGILRKLGQSSRADAVLAARRAGLL